MENSLTDELSPPWLQISFRVLLGGIFIWAGIIKLMDLNYFVESVSNFQIPPFSTEPWDMWVGYTLPAFELIVGSCLILGVLYKGAIVSSAALSAVFLAAIFSVHIRGLNIECGCFGKALTFKNYYTHMAVLAGMVAIALALAWMEWRSSRSNATFKRAI